MTAACHLIAWAALAAAPGDADVLVEVSINPESRVKAARGPAAAVLRAGRPVRVVVKVVNEGGVRAALRVRSPQAGPGGFVTVAFPPGPLGGGAAEYVAGTLTCAAGVTGKREVLLVFDVGQGTQDLGFRAELPVLFRVEP